MTHVTMIEAAGRRFLQAGVDRYELPRDSAHLYRSSKHFSAIWQDDFLFVIGQPVGPEIPQATGFAFTGDQGFILSDRFAFNDKPPFGTDAQKAAQTAFKAYMLQNPGSFPSYQAVRKHEGDGKGYWLFSGGAFVLIVHDFGHGPELRIPLYRRTYPPKVFTEANGIVAEAGTAAKEALEEWGLVGIDGQGRHTVYAVDFKTPSLDDDYYVAFKRTQEEVLRANLAKAGVVPPHLDWDRAHIEEITVLPQNTYTLYDHRGGVVDHLTGVTGREDSYRTFIYRRFGIFRPPADCVDVIVADPELDRIGLWLTADAFRAEAAKDDNMLASTAAVGLRLLDALPPRAALMMERGTYNLHHPRL